MKDRLIELLEKADKKCADTKQCENCVGCGHGAECVNHLIADCLLSEGVIVPPVKVGQKVWYIKGGYYNAKYKKPCPIEVKEINQKWHGKILDWGFIANGTRYRFSSIGKTVFLTEEEAEKALAGRSGNEK